MGLNLTTSLRILLQGLTILGLIACSGPKPSPLMTPGQKPIVDIADLFQSGHVRFQNVLNQDEILNEIWLERREQVVLVLIDIEWEDGEREQAIQSGIILKDGKLIVTAAHGFLIDDGEILEIHVQGVSGEKVKVDLISLEHDEESVPVVDWAILQPLKVLPYSEADLLPATDDRKRLMVLGFPATMGLNKKGQVVHVFEKGAGVAYPLGVICSHHVFDKHTLFPEAGAIPLRGISGAPVFNISGELIGLFSSISRRRNIQGWHYTFGIVDVPWKVLDSLVPK